MDQNGKKKYALQSRSCMVYYVQTPVFTTHLVCCCLFQYLAAHGNYRGKKHPGFSVETCKTTYSNYQLAKILKTYVVAAIYSRNDSTKHTKHQKFQLQILIVAKHGANHHSGVQEKIQHSLYLS